MRCHSTWMSKTCKLTQFQGKGCWRGMNRRKRSAGRFSGLVHVVLGGAAGRLLERRPSEALMQDRMNFRPVSPSNLLKSGERLRELLLAEGKASPFGGEACAATALKPGATP